MGGSWGGSAHQGAHPTAARFARRPSPSRGGSASPCSSGVRAEGRYVVIGNIAADQTIAFNPAWLVHLNRRMIGVGGYQAWALRRGLELVERTRDRYPYRAIMSHRYPLERINEAFANADQGKAVRTALICAPDLVEG